MVYQFYTDKKTDFFIIFRILGVSTSGRILFVLLNIGLFSETHSVDISIHKATSAFRKTNIHKVKIERHKTWLNGFEMFCKFPSDSKNSQNIGHRTRHKFDFYRSSEFKTLWQGLFWSPCFGNNINNRSLGALRAPTSRLRPFGLALGPNVLHALRALRPCDPRTNAMMG